MDTAAVRRLDATPLDSAVSGVKRSSSLEDLAGTEAASVRRASVAFSKLDVDSNFKFADRTHWPLFEKLLRKTTKSSEGLGDSGKGGWRAEASETERALTTYNEVVMHVLSTFVCARRANCCACRGSCSDVEPCCWACP